MKLQSPRLIQREDLGKKAPPWTAALLSALNRAIESMADILQRNASAKDNFNAELRELEVSHNVQFQLKLRTLNGRARHVWSTYCLSPEGAIPPLLGCVESPDDSRLLLITPWFPGGTGTYTIRIRIEGD